MKQIDASVGHLMHCVLVGSTSMRIAVGSSRTTASVTVKPGSIQCSVAPMHLASLQASSCVDVGQI